MFDGLNDITMAAPSATLPGTNYVLAGYVALGATKPTADWQSLDQSWIFPDPAALAVDMGVGESLI